MFFNYRCVIVSGYIWIEISLCFVYISTGHNFYDLLCNPTVSKLSHFWQTRQPRLIITISEKKFQTLFYLKFSFFTISVELYRYSWSCVQCCGTVTIYYGSGSGSGSDFWKVMVPVPVPVPTFEKLWFRFRFRFLLLKKLRFRFRFRFQVHI